MPYFGVTEAKRFPNGYRTKGWIPDRKEEYARDHSPGVGPTKAHPGIYHILPLNAHLLGNVHTHTVKDPTNEVFSKNDQINMSNYFSGVSNWWMVSPTANLMYLNTNQDVNPSGRAVNKGSIYK